MELRETFQKVKTASKTLSLLSDDQRNEILQAEQNGQNCRESVYTWRSPFGPY